MAKVKGTKKKKPTTKSKVKKRSILFKLTRWCFVLSIWGLLFLAGVLLWFAKDLPDITEQASFERRSSIVVKASDGSVIGRYGESKGKNITVDNMPPLLVQAVLATEDRRFYSHPGIDILGISRAMMTNISRGRFVQGGSTITQQLAKNLFLTHQRKLKRKIQEALLAIWLERQLTKDEILSAYMNRVYLGSGTYGFEAAAQLYFNKSARDVNLREAAVLAGLLKAPSRYSPHNSIELAKKRSDVVLNAMKDAGYISDEDTADQAAMALILPHRVSNAESNIRYFTDWVIDGLDDLVGRPDMDLIIETTLDARLQKNAQNTLVNAIDQADDMQFVSQGAILSMRPDGAIIAMVGGYDYGQSQFNRVTQAKRSPGSAFKPFVFLAAIEKGWDAKDKILDSPITTGEYRPKNFAGQYYGTVDLETAMAKSMNTATVRLAQEIGIKSVMNTAKKVGIISKMERDLSLALGSSGISILEMGTAYSTLANGGYRVFPYTITRITNSNGRVLYTRKNNISHQAIIRSKHVKELSFMMRSVINNGTGKNAKLPFPAQGKTGTSQDSRDAWFVGYTDKMVSVVWLGNDDNSPMRQITGGGLPASIWKTVMMDGNNRQPDVAISGQPHDQDTGFTNMVGRLFSNDNDAPPRPKRKNDYSNLNQ